MSELNKLIEEKESQQKEIADRKNLWTNSVRTLYTNIQGWLSDFPQVKIYEGGGSPVNSIGRPSNLTIKILDSTIELKINEQMTNRYIASLEMMSQKGRKRLGLSHQGEWIFDAKSDSFYSRIKPETSAENIAVNKESFHSAIAQLVK